MNPSLFAVVSPVNNDGIGLSVLLALVINLAAGVIFPGPCPSLKPSDELVEPIEGGAF